MVGYSDLRVIQGSIGLWQGDGRHGANDRCNATLNVVLYLEVWLAIYIKHFVVDANW